MFDTLSSTDEVKNVVASPKWLSSMLSEKYYDPCIVHKGLKKNEKHIFCLDCCHSICRHCVSSSHKEHRLLQIRKYVYHDVIRVVDANKLIDCSLIHTYTSNGAKVVFLNERPQTRAPKLFSGDHCAKCDRKVQNPNRYCCLYCKVENIGSDISSHLRNCEVMDLPDPSLDDGQMTPDTVLEPTGSLITESGSSSGDLDGHIDYPFLVSTATTEVVRKKRSNLSAPRTGFGPAFKLVSGFSCDVVNRRKGTPQRAPLL